MLSVRTPISILLRSISPDQASGWELEIDLEWNDLSLANRFQLSLYARPSRSVAASAALRLPQKGRLPAEIKIADFELSSDDRNALVSGDLVMPDFVDLDTFQKPQLLLTFGTESDLSMIIHYFNVYFA